MAVTLAIAAGAGVATAADDDEAVVYTGCLSTEGDVSQVAVGEEPLSPCDESSQLARWNQEGPQGQQGEQGEQGEQGQQGEQGEKGEKGDPGTSNTYFVSGAYEGLAIISGVARCDEGDLVTGGGFRQLSGPPTTIVENFASGRRAWTVTMLAADGSVTPIGMEVHAVCSDLEPLR
jgi:hypothetical protein